MNKTITIPRQLAHRGLYALTVSVPWVCLVCGKPRGTPSKGVSYDGSQRLEVDCWKNPCGHVEPYAMIRAALAVAS